jgi:protein-disulfide isomerase
LDANIQENEILQQSYGLRGHPTLVVLDKNGEISEKFVGEQSKEILQAAITAVLP